MLDTKAITKMIEEQIADSVNNQVLEILTTQEWLNAIEEKIIKYGQDQVVDKFGNASAVPELVEAIKKSVAELYECGLIPNIKNFIDQDTIKKAVDQAVEQNILSAIQHLGQDAAWLQKIERMINQSVINQTLATLNSIEVDNVIQTRVDELFRQRKMTNFCSSGIVDTATKNQLTVMDDTVVIENQLVAKDFEAVDSIKVKNLMVTGGINIEDPSWDPLNSKITDSVLASISDKWRRDLTQQISSDIKQNGINFADIKIGNDFLIKDNQLSTSVTESNLQKVGQLRTLNVAGETNIGETFTVNKNRVGINTASPEMALSVWDEEVCVIVGKHKSKQAYVGTSRDQGLVLGTNRTPHLEIDTDGVTTIKKLRLGNNLISHGTEAPGYSGTRGDLVININPGNDRVFGWVCLGAFKWQTLRCVE